MDAAERSILARGFQASTMELIAREAGYSRAAMYRHFPNRRRLLEELVARKTRGLQQHILERLPAGSGLADMLVESLVIVATELVDDPLLQTLSEHTEDGTIAQLIVQDPSLSELITLLVDTLDLDRDGLREGLHPNDVAQYLVTTAITLLIGVVPDSSNPETARRYLRTFFLPALLSDPPDPVPVFKRGNQLRRR
ncbi:TetR/AcrR family transcriptional regulator [Mycolicibacterium chubuense]|uniref:Nucleoid occlusion factor SlmA n=1 Tax=Mycolicibacterium chubuense TaxID=1800 RepID=A0A0J6ZE97_MYCCU|nr:TetR/AcrR family transcriptional regulator [Mycolicibacterium chubuense]KMO83076.1 Nucleoid occlusion factor SlmA [Mycolicibacterium chubuense]SPY00713.1 transcriptional regulator [Mycolicibacterium chubuense]